MITKMNMIFPMGSSLRGNDPTNKEYSKSKSPDNMPEVDDMDIDHFDKYIGACVICNIG